VDDEIAKYESLKRPKKKKTKKQVMDIFYVLAQDSWVSPYWYFQNKTGAMVKVTIESVKGEEC